jgi:hypothetical protein
LLVPKHFVLFLQHTFFLKTMLCALFMQATGGSEESIYYQIPYVLLFSLAQRENVLPGVLHCYFVDRNGNIMKARG